jgi:hypothetical protein
MRGGSGQRAQSRQPAARCKKRDSTLTISMACWHTFLLPCDAKSVTRLGETARARRRFCWKCERLPCLVRFGFGLKISSNFVPKGAPKEKAAFCAAFSFEPRRSFSVGGPDVIRCYFRPDIFSNGARGARPTR